MLFKTVAKGIVCYVYQFYISVTILTSKTIIIYL